MIMSTGWAKSGFREACSGARPTGCSSGSTAWPATATRSALPRRHPAGLFARVGCA